MKLRNGKLGRDGRKLLLLVVGVEKQASTLSRAGREEEPRRRRDPCLKASL